MAVCQNATAPKLSQRIDKNAIIAKYDEDCHRIGYSNQVTTVKKGEPTYLPTAYPTIFQLVRDCSMKPSNNHHYRVKDLVFENVIIVVLKFVNSFLSDVCIKKLKCLSHSFYKMVTDVCRLRTIDKAKNRLLGSTRDSVFTSGLGHRWNDLLFLAPRHVNKICQGRVRRRK
jgi:hypothetical protein